MSEKDGHDLIEFSQDLQKRGWRGKNYKADFEGCIVGEIIYNSNQVLCYASAINPRFVISMASLPLKLRASSLYFSVTEIKGISSRFVQYPVLQFEQQQIDDYCMTIFELDVSRDSLSRHFGLLSYTFPTLFQEFIESKRKILLPFLSSNDHISDITNTGLIILKKRDLNQQKQQSSIVDCIGIPVIADDPQFGACIIAIIVQSTQSHYKAIALNDFHFDFMKSVIFQDVSHDHKQKKDIQMIGNLHRLESRVINSFDGENAHSQAVYSLCRISDNCFASSSIDGTIRLWDYDTSKLTQTFEIQGCCRYFVSEKNHLIGTSENRVVVIDCQKRCIQNFIHCHYKINSLLLLKDTRSNSENQIILAGDCIGNINIIVDFKNVVFQIQCFEASKYSGGHRGTINVMHSIEESSSCFITAGEYGEIKLWDAQTFEFAGQLLGHDTSKSVYFLESIFVQSGRLTLISGSSDQTIRFWDLQTQTSIQIVQLSQPVYAACLLNRNELIVGDSCAVRIIPLDGIEANNAESVSFDKHTSRVNAVCRISDTSFASGDTEGNIMTWMVSRYDSKMNYQSEYEESKQLSKHEVQENLNSASTVSNIYEQSAIGVGQNNLHNTFNLKGASQRDSVAKKVDPIMNLSQSLQKNSSSRKPPQKSLVLDLAPENKADIQALLEKHRMQGIATEGVIDATINQNDSNSSNNIIQSINTNGGGFLSGLKQSALDPGSVRNQQANYTSINKRNKQEFPFEQQKIVDQKKVFSEGKETLFNAEIPGSRINKINESYEEYDLTSSNILNNKKNLNIINNNNNSSQLNEERDSFSKEDDDLEGEEIRSEYLMQRNSELDKIPVLELENVELKEKLKEQQSKLNKYEKQIQQLLETLQKKEEEQLSFVNQYKDVAHKIQESSELIKELQKRNSDQEIQLQQKDQEIYTMSFMLKQRALNQSLENNRQNGMQYLSNLEKKKQNYQKQALEEQAKNLEKDILKLKQETLECQKETELVIILEELKHKHSLFEQKKMMLLEFS